MLQKNQLITSMSYTSYASFFIFFSFVFVFQACSYKEVYNLRYTGTITELDYLEFSPNVLLIDERNQMFYHDTLSKQRNEIIDSLLVDNKRLRIGKKLVTDFEFEQSKIADELTNLEQMYQEKLRANETTIPPFISSFMKRKNSEVMAITIVNGYVRSDERNKELIRNAIIVNMITIPTTGIAFIPLSISDPHRAYYRLIVFDSRCNCVRYYRNYPKLKHSVLNDKKLREQINYMYRNMYLAIETL